MTYVTPQKSKKNSLATTTTGDITAIATTIPIADTSVCYDVSGNLITVGYVLRNPNSLTTPSPEEITITGCSVAYGTGGAGNLTGVTRAVNYDVNTGGPQLGAAYAWPTGTVISVMISTGVFNILTGDIADIQTNKTTTSNKIDDFAICGTSDTTKDANTTNHGLLLKAVAPATGFMRFVGIAYGETIYALKELFAATTPSMDGAASAGTALTAARIDHIHPTDTSRAAASSIGSWGSFSPSPSWGTATPTITSTVARYVKNGAVVDFSVSFVISNGNGATSLTLALPAACSQVAGYQRSLIAFKSITTGGNSIMSDPFAYIDYTVATPIVKFAQFGTLPSGYTAVLNVSGSYEVNT